MLKKLSAVLLFVVVILAGTLHAHNLELNHQVDHSSHHCLMCKGTLMSFESKAPVAGVYFHYLFQIVLPSKTIDSYRVLTTNLNRAPPRG